MSKYQNYIKEHVTTRELLELLAEESAELTQASLKAIRAYGLSNSPTPIEEHIALNKIIEEKCDVNLVYKVFMGFDVDEKQYPKLKRWAERLGYED